MQVLELMTVTQGSHRGEIRLLLGDLSALPAEAEADVVIVSAFPGDYSPAPGTLMAALKGRNVDVNELARDMEVDARTVTNCWLSKPLRRPDLNINRVLVFEPPTSHRAAELVGDVFRSLFPFVVGEPWIRRVALPLLASGDQSQPRERMLQAVLEAGVRWIATGLAIERLDIVLWEGEHPATVASLRKLFTRFRDEHVPDTLTQALQPPTADRYDLFISYSHQDTDLVHVLRDEIARQAPDLTVFIDSSSLEAGTAWQQRIYAALEGSDRVVCLYSPGYLASSVCLEELNLAILLNRDRDGLLVPAYIKSAPLPAYMRLIHYIDVREGQGHKLVDLATRIVAKVRDGAPRPVAAAPAALMAGSSGTEVPSPARPDHPTTGHITIDVSALLDRLAAGDEVQINATITVRPRHENGSL